MFSQCYISSETIIGTKHSIEHLKVLGIHPSKRGEFLKKYHDELIKLGVSKENTDGYQKEMLMVLLLDSSSAARMNVYNIIW